VTYEVLSDNAEDEQLMQQVISSALTSIVNQDRNQLRQRLQITNPPAKPTTSTPKEKFARENVDQPELIEIGGKWLYAVSVVTSEQGGKAVRIAKGPIKGNWRRNKATGDMEYYPDDPMNPIALVNKVNIKTLDEWNRLQGPVITRLQVLQETK
jgi:hypothetical protein